MKNQSKAKQEQKTGTEKVKDEPQEKNAEKKSEKPQEVNLEKSDEINLGGRNRKTYTFNGVPNLNKGRLALAIVTAYAKEKKPTLKQALELWPDAIVPPYGLIKPIADAKKMSEKYQRFFIKPEEEVKLKDTTVAVSNQMTPERIDKIIAIARKLGYKIK